MAHRIRNRLKLLANWLFLDPWPVWLALVPPMLAVLVSWYLPFVPELRVRAAGFVVTIAGVGLVVKGIQEKRALFGRPTFMSRFRGWIARLPGILGGPRVVNAKASLSLGGLIAVGEGYVTATAPADATLEQRVAVLEENLTRVHDRITRLGERLKSEVSKLTSVVGTERAERERGDKEIRDRIEEFSVGGLDLEAAGVVWVLAGAVCGTFPGELAVGLAYLFS